LRPPGIGVEATEAEGDTARPRPKNIFEAEATMYEVKAEARHIAEELIVYEL